MSITNYVKSCGTKVIPGNDYKLFVAAFPDIASITTDTDGFVTAITMEAAATFSYWEADIDSVQFTANGQSDRGFFSEQHLIAMFSRKSTALKTSIDEARGYTGCGLVIIRKDGNGKYWLSGIAPSAEMGANRPYLAMTTNFDSGASIENIEEGNRLQVDFSRMSGTEEYELLAGDLSISSEIDAGTATFIGWPA
jgi:hypothetical protein